MSPRRLSAVDAIRQRVDPLVKDGLTDASHAQRFAEGYGLELKHHHRRGVWLVYHDPCWRPDTDGCVYRLALEFVRARQAAALGIPDHKAKERVLRFTLAAESKPNLDRLVGLAKNLYPMADAGDSWDADPWLTGAPNGVVDWRTGALLRGDPSHRVTKMLGVPFDANAKAPRWTQFIEEVFAGDRDLIGFIHRYLGYACTGITREQVLALFWGAGGNGKGVLMHVVAWVLGDYFGNMGFSTVELKQRATIPSDLAALEGKRLVTASESGEVRLNEPRIKALTGCDPVLAHASPHLQVLIIAALETGCRVGELLSLQWHQVRWDENVLLLPAHKTKTATARDVPMTTRLLAVLEMRRQAPDGAEHPATAYVFGNEVGEKIGRVMTAWLAACRRANISDLHFHDLRREFASRLLESGVSDHEVRDWLGHANITTTSRYLSTTRVRLQRARALFETSRKPQEEVASSKLPKMPATSGVIQISADVH